MRAFYPVVGGLSAFFLLFLACLNPKNTMDQLVLSITADSTVAVRDTVHFSVSLNTRNDEKLTYYWMFDDLRESDTTDEPAFVRIWNFPDTGVHEVTVYARNADGDQSASATCMVHVICHQPEIIISGDTTAFINDTLHYIVTTSDSDGTVDHFVLSYGERRYYHDLDDCLLIIKWTEKEIGLQPLIVQAVDDDGLKSAFDTLMVHVNFSVPLIEGLGGDSVISVNDTAWFSCNGTDKDGYIKQYEWTVSGQKAATFFGGKNISHVWRYPDTGVHSVSVRLIDDDGIASSTDSIRVWVSANAPYAALQKTHSAFIGDTIAFLAKATDSDGRVVRYIWNIGSSEGMQTRTTDDSTISVTWLPNDTGRQLVGVTVCDDDSLYSVPAVCTVNVYNKFPQFTPFPDTIVSTLDTVVITGKLRDTTQKIIRYYWDIGGKGLVDSTVVPVYRFTYSGCRMISVIAGAMNSDSLQSHDTFTVTFNSPPMFTGLSFFNGDTVWAGERAFPGKFSYTAKIDDPDGDVTSCSIVWAYGDSIDTIFVHDTASLPLYAPGIYVWKLTVADTFNHVTTLPGSVIIGREHTICFAGHSIAAGLGDTTYSGGFRCGVLAALRDTLPLYHRIRATGPFSTGLIAKNTNDDSCFAISGSFAREMLLLADHAYQSVSADIWVMMLGVNGSFNGIETEASIGLIKRMFSRNPFARVYVLTSQPFSRLSGNERYWFNRNLRDTVDALKNRGFSAFIVESGDSILSYNGAFNDSLKYDEVHPNVEGYRRLTKGILRVMWDRTLNVLPFRKNE